MKLRGSEILESEVFSVDGQSGKCEIAYMYLFDIIDMFTFEIVGKIQYSVCKIFLPYSVYSHV